MNPQYIDHAAQAPHSVPALQAFPDRLYVVCCIANPVRFHSRYRLYRAFEKHMQESGCILYTIEAAFGGRPFEVTSPDHPRHIQLRTSDEVWHKENLLNIAIARLPAEAKYIATVDADFEFTRPDWAQETIQQLQHFDAVQMYSEIVYLGPKYETLTKGQSFMQLWMDGKPLRGFNGSAVNRSSRPPVELPGYGYGYGSCPKGAYGPPGGAWAYRRSALDRLGGLMDFVIHGGGDHYMALALIGQLGLYMPPSFHSGFQVQLREWEARALRHLRKNIGVVPGTVMHHWHGAKKHRGYGNRWRIVVQNNFDPARHLKRDAQNIWQLEDDGTEHFIGLRDGLRAYFRSRNEDSIDVN